VENSGGGAPTRRQVVVVGGGYTGLAAAFDLARAGHQVTVLESAGELGGLASAFPVGHTRLERFYHHWFTNDVHVMGLIRDLGAEDQVRCRPTVTGMYYANRLFRLASPLDLLRFTALSLPDRIRLGLLVIKARMEKDWRRLDHISAAEWLTRLAGPQVYRVVWEPLLKGKFGEFAERVSASWFWAKLVLRGGSRGKGAHEHLAYFEGGFAALTDRLAADIVAHGGVVRTRAPASGLVVEDGRVTGVLVGAEVVPCDSVICTPALPIIADLLEPHTPADFVARLRQVEYLANVCLILLLDRSLSGLYWMNVNDPTFPFVGIIEHTNFEPPESYEGHHIVYLSKYLPESAELYRMKDDEVLRYALPHIKRMFPDFQEEWIKASHVWHARYGQPVVTTGYGDLVPPRSTPVEGVHIATMAQVYPEDRGTNYAVRDGRAVARHLMSEI
jgi:protoporphyrinogen oxidase